MSNGGGLKQRLGRVVFANMPITRFLFDQLRVEANAAMALTLRTVSPAMRARLRRLRNERHLLVNVGCGPQVCEGFLNIDLFPARPDVLRYDCRRGLPLADSSAAAIKIEHFVEHLEPREELPLVLSDCHRVLEPGGVLRIAVPDAEQYVRAYVSDSAAPYAPLGMPTLPSDLPTRMDVLNHVFHQWHEHRWGYDYETLANRLRRAGFSTVERSAFRRSRLPLLADVDLSVHAPYSLYVEAVRETNGLTVPEPMTSSARH